MTTWPWERNDHNESTPTHHVSTLHHLRVDTISDRFGGFVEGVMASKEYTKNKISYCSRCPFELCNVFPILISCEATLRFAAWRWQRRGPHRVLFFWVVAPQAAAHETRRHQVAQHNLVIVRSSSYARCLVRVAVH